MLSATILTILTTIYTAGPVTGPVVIRTCAPPPDMCGTLGDLIADATGDTDAATKIAEGICPGSRCMACDAARDACDAIGGDCSELDAFCDDALDGCSCTMKCKDTTQLEPVELLALCLAHPMATGDDCEDPSVGQCLTTISWSGCAGLTTCQYAECHEDLEILAECPVEPADWPDTCELVLACDAAEELGGAPLAPDDVFRGCAVPGDLCQDLRQTCSDADMSLHVCDGFAATCKTDPCSACDDALARCATANTNCDALEDLCASALQGCCKTQSDCCDEHGTLDGKPNTCAISNEPFCIGCDGDPVLCMTHGCSEPNAKDCCLSPQGETVAC